MYDKPLTTWRSRSDQALAGLIGEYVQHHRLEQNTTQEALSRAAGISRSTLSLLERGETVTLATLIQVLRALDQLHVLSAFEVTREVSPLVMARAEKYQRKRARKSGHTPETTSDW